MLGWRRNNNNKKRPQVSARTNTEDSADHDGDGRQSSAPPHRRGLGGRKSGKTEGEITCQWRGGGQKGASRHGEVDTKPARRLWGQCGMCLSAPDTWHTWAEKPHQTGTPESKRPKAPAHRHGQVADVPQVVVPRAVRWQTDPA